MNRPYVVRVCTMTAPVKTIVVAAGVLVSDGKVLITQRKAGTHLAGAWEFPGGKVEEGEDPREALERELREEVGIEAQAGEILDVTFHRYPERAVLLLFFETTLRAGSPEPRPLDIAALKWAASEDLDERQFPPADLNVLRKVRALLAS